MTFALAKFLARAAFSGIAILAGGAALAQADYPKQPIRMVVGFAPGACELLPALGVFFAGSRRINEDGAEVIDVGVGRPCCNQVAETAEKSGRIVVGKKGSRVELAQRAVRP